MPDLSLKKPGVIQVFLFLPMVEPVVEPMVELWWQLLKNKYLTAAKISH
jgi:hypothetical protein